MPKYGGLYDCQQNLNIKLTFLNSSSGMGGQGGAVVFKANEEATLKQLWKKFPSKRIIAGNGEDSNRMRILGRRGADIIVEVPPGVTIIDEEARKIVGEINEEGETLLASGGGTGGCTGNNFIGHKGQHRMIKLDLKLIADIGLVGFPNAGKSTLLKAISRANPKIASYPFTTIQPQIGTIEYSDYRQITMADLPGLIEGAHRNIGMGHQFLKHVERTSLLLLIVDIFGFQMTQNHNRRNCLENIYALNKELELYDPTLLDKPTILLVNKMDTNGSVEEYQRYEKNFEDLSLALEECPHDIRPEQILKFERIIPISAKCNKEIDKVKAQVREVLDKVNERKLEAEAKDDYEDRVDKKLREHGPKMV
jgi:Obg family GTPase CgtA